METNFSHLNVVFYADKVLNKRKTAKSKRPIFDDVEKVKIRMAGDTKTVIGAYANDQSSRRDPDTGLRLTYAELHVGPYESFKKGEAAKVDGTPIEMLTALSQARMAELKGSNIMTIEQLAGLDGTLLAKLGMNARNMKNDAQDYLDKTMGNADMMALSDENADLKARLVRLEAAMAGSDNTTVEEVMEAEKVATPFDDWDKDTIKEWMVDQGGSFDARWSIERCREEAVAFNETLAKAA